MTKINPLDRRTFLKGASVSLALPMLESTTASQGATHDNNSAYQPKRLVCVGVYLGFHQRDFFVLLPDNPNVGVEKLETTDEALGAKRDYKDWERPRMTQ